MRGARVAGPSGAVCFVHVRRQSAVPACRLRVADWLRSSRAQSRKRRGLDVTFQVEDACDREKRRADLWRNVSRVAFVAGRPPSLLSALPATAEEGLGEPRISRPT